MTHTTPAQRAAALSKLVHDEYLDLGGNLPGCSECAAISGLLTGLVRMARELPTKAELIEALVAECAETLGLVEPELMPTPAVTSYLAEQQRISAPTTASMADHTTTTRVSLLGTGR